MLEHEQYSQCQGRKVSIQLICTSIKYASVACHLSASFAHTNYTHSQVGKENDKESFSGKTNPRRSSSKCDSKKINKNSSQGVFAAILPTPLHMYPVHSTLQ